MLLDKAENDDKLVAMLKSEVSRLENVKGVKSQLRTPGTGGDEKIVIENKQLKNEVQCLQIELEQKDNKIK